MAKVKLTKTALKQERDSLKQFQRFLPTLQLKKQQLQLEMRTCLERIESNKEREAQAKAALSGWVVLFGTDSVPARLGEILKVREVISGIQNIAGVNVPVFERVDFEGSGTDLYHDDPWLDDAVDAVKNIISPIVFSGMGDKLLAIFSVSLSVIIYLIFLKIFSSIDNEEIAWAKNITVRKIQNR